MTTLYGTVSGGKIELTAPPGCPDGTPVRAIVGEQPILPTGLPDDDDGSPAAIARRLELMEQVVPWMTDEEDAAWRADLARRKAEQLAMWDKANADIDRLFP